MNNSITITALLTFVITVFVGSMMSNHYALADNYESTRFRLIENPLICMLDPSPNPLLPTLTADLSQITKGAISEWIVHNSSSWKSYWNVYFNEVSSDKTSNFDSSKCDIAISYLPSSTSFQDQSELYGITTYDYDHHKARIVMYYLAITTEFHTKNILNAYLEYWETTAGYDQNHMAPQLSTALRHELGHAFGLGNYIMSQQDIYNIVKFGYPIPSIMLHIVMPPYRSDYQGIMPEDIQELKSLYGVKGFQSPIQPIPSPIQSSTPPPTDLTSQSTTNIPKWVKNDALYWTNGDISDYDFIKSMKYMIKQGIMKFPNRSAGASSETALPTWVKDNVKLWAHGGMTDDDFAQAIQFLIDEGSYNR